MKITDLPAYKRLEDMFQRKGYSLGVKDEMPIYYWKDISRLPRFLTPGHYVSAHQYGEIEFCNIPEKYRTREFFLHALSSSYKDIVAYVRTHLDKFDRQFFKDHIATNYYGLQFELNDFEYMPLEYIDEEMVACAMFRSINMRYCERRGDCEAWFYSVYRRKPGVLTQELYTLGARCFAAKRNGKNEFLDITPEKYRTTEYYYALCLENHTPVMEDIPESVLTTRFLVDLLKDNPENIQCFSEAALEKEVPMAMNGKNTLKFWQAAIILDGYQIRSIPLNDERVEFFLSRYDKDSSEYELSFKNHYKKYLREKNGTPEPDQSSAKLAGLSTLLGAMLGMTPNSAVEFGNSVMNTVTNRQAMLPIHCRGRVPNEYCKQYDKEEYLLEIYKKIGIQVLQEADYYFYNVVLPENISIVQEGYCGYSVKNSNGETLIHYYDRGSFYDRSVEVDEINITL